MIVTRTGPARNDPPTPGQGYSKIDPMFDAPTPANLHSVGRETDPGGFLAVSGPLPLHETT